MQERAIISALFSLMQSEMAGASMCRFSAAQLAGLRLHCCFCILQRRTLKPMQVLHRLFQVDDLPCCW